MEDGMKIVSDRWMLQSRQIVNWGSYGEYYVFRPSMDDAMPVTLLAGASESGKSTLVDAQISLLYRSGTPYNKASNSGRSERNDYTYLRGMIGISDGENGETPIFLRGRDAHAPPEHLGALVDTYANRSDGGTVVLRKIPLPDRRRRAGRTAPPIRHLEPDHRPAPHGPAPRHVIHARTDGTDLPRMHDARQRAGVSRLHLAGHGPKRRSMQAPAQESNLPTRPPNSTTSSNRACSMCPNPSGSPAKPSTTTTGSARTSTAWKTKWNASPSCRTYKPATANTPNKPANAANTRPSTPTASKARRRSPHGHGRAWPAKYAPDCHRATQSQGIPGRHRPVSAAHRRTRHANRSCQRTMNGIDGGSLQQLGKDFERARQDADEARRQRHAIAERFERVEGRLPADEQTWNAKRAALALSLDTYDKAFGRRAIRIPADGGGTSRPAGRTRPVEAGLPAQDRKQDAHQRRHGPCAQAHRTGDGLGRDGTAVRGRTDGRGRGDERWRLAMDVTYAPIAKTILVDKRHEQGFAAKVSAIDPTRMTRRAWRFVDTDAQYDSACNEGWMSSKLRYKEDSPFVGWLKEQTASQRFDARCVEAIDDMGRAERQVQVDGQIKSGDRGFHGVKGLRQVIGFVNERYLAELERQLDGAERALEDADRRGRQMANAMTLLQDEHELALTVADLPWGKIDVDGLEDEGGTDPSADRTDRKRSGTGTIAGRVETAATAEGRRGQEQVPCRSGIGKRAACRPCRTGMARHAWRLRFRRCRIVRHGVESAGRHV